MEKVLNDIILLMSNGLATYVLYRYMHIFFENRKKGKRTVIAVYLLQYVISAFVMIKISYPILNIFIALLCYGMLTFCYEGSIGKKITVIILIYVLGLSIEVVVAFAMQITGVSLLNKVDVNILGTLVIHLIEWIITLILEKWLKRTNKNKNIPFVFVLVICIAMVVEVFIGCLILSQTNLHDTIRLLIFVCLFLICFLMIYLYQTLSFIFIERAQRELINQERNFYHNQAEILQENSEKIRKFHHDYKNKMIVLQELLEKNDLITAKKYLVEVTEKLEYAKAYSKSGNVILDSLINYKLSKAEEQGICVRAEIKLPGKIAVEGDDMVVILGNLLDNAIEATSKLNENQKIQISITQVKGTLCIKISNTFDGRIKKKAGKLQTKKEDNMNHGIGLESVEGIVQKYHGEMKVLYENEIFMVILYLY